MLFKDAVANKLPEGFWFKLNEGCQVLDILDFWFTRKSGNSRSNNQQCSLLSLRSETGLLAMKHRIWLEKMRMVRAIQKLDYKALARVIFKEQLSQGWSGLAREVKMFWEEINIPDVHCYELKRSYTSRVIEEMRKWKEIG